jgi:hypothetical protein
MVAVVSNDMVDGRVWYACRIGVAFNVSRVLGARSSFVNCIIGDVVLRLVRGEGR